MSTLSVFSSSAGPGLSDAFRTTSKNEMVTDHASFDPVRDPYLDLLAAVERQNAGLSVFGIEYLKIKDIGQDTNDGRVLPEVE